MDPSPSEPNFIERRAIAACVRRVIANKARTLPQGFEAIELGQSHDSGPYSSDVQLPIIDLDTFEALPDASMDVIVSVDLLSLVTDPGHLLAAVSRKLRSGGVSIVFAAFATRFRGEMHEPQDFWRWTHTGLLEMHERHGSWECTRLHAVGGIGAAFAGLISESPATSSPLTVLSLNFIGANVDRFYSRLYPDRVPDLSPGYVVEATRA